MKGINTASSKRKSHENMEVQKLYDDMLGKTLSEVSERLLHTEFASTGSARDKLSRLLSAIDHRDGESQQIYAQMIAFGIPILTVLELYAARKISNF